MMERRDKITPDKATALETFSFNQQRGGNLNICAELSPVSWRFCALVRRDLGLGQECQEPPAVCRRRSCRGQRVGELVCATARQVFEPSLNRPLRINNNSFSWYSQKSKPKVSRLVCSIDQLVLEHYLRLQGTMFQTLVLLTSGDWTRRFCSCPHLWLKISAEKVKCFKKRLWTTNWEILDKIKWIWMESAMRR